MVKLDQLKLVSLTILLITFSLFFSISLSNPNPNNPDFTTLLAFKSSADTSNSLSSWSNTNTTNTCTSWLGVTCHPTTHRVTKLVLNYLNLTGSIQTLTRLTHLRHLSLHHNHLSSLSPLNLTSLHNLRHVYLSHNSFSGPFPIGLSHLHLLRRLDLSYNMLTGEIPMTELTQFPYLLTLRLQFNSFTGTLNPNGSTSSSSISDLNVAGNNLAGKIPDWLSKFPATSFEGNFLLCGKPLPLDCQNRTVISDPMAGGDSVQMGGGDSDNNKKNSLSDLVVLVIISVDAVAVVLALVTITCCCYKRRLGRDRERKREVVTREVYGSEVRECGRGKEMVCFEGCTNKGFAKVDNLLKASAEILGKGSLGATYKVVMECSGDVVVVKRVKERRKIMRMKEVDGLLRVIGGLGHPNVVALRAYCSTKEELLLVYDFLPNGSLHSLLHGNRGPGRTPLDWTTRLKLASGTASGLAFLHGYNKSKIFHGHLTSSNVLVDHLGNACISDAGLHQLLQIPSSSSKNSYTSPELLPNNNNGHTNHNRKFSQKSDVYSFGAILLEILTGKVATSEEGAASLGNWIKRAMVEEWRWDVLDFELVRYKEMEEEMLALLQVAMLCLAPSPKDRPKISIVHEMIEDIRTKGGRGGGVRSPLNELASDSSLSLSDSTLNFTSN